MLGNERPMNEGGEAEQPKNRVFRRGEVKWIDEQVIQREYDGRLGGNSCLKYGGL